MNTQEPVCAHCGHAKSKHWVGRGCCKEWSHDGPCHCSQYIRLRWDKWQPAKIGTQPGTVRFRVHNNPTRWSVHIGKKVEFQIKGSPAVETGIVTQTNPIAFIERH